MTSPDALDEVEAKKVRLWRDIEDRHGIDEWSTMARSVVPPSGIEAYEALPVTQHDALVAAARAGREAVAVALDLFDRYVDAGTSTIVRSTVGGREGWTDGGLSTAEDFFAYLGLKDFATQQEIEIAIATKRAALARVEGREGGSGGAQTPRAT